MPNQTHEYVIEPGYGPNPINLAATAFLEAAESEFARETAKAGFWALQSWFVVHHLSVIATELFLKSLTSATVSHGRVASEDGPDDMVFKPAFDGHRANHDKLPAAELSAFLPSHLCGLIASYSVADIQQGRYPYEPDCKGSYSSRFPSGEDGRRLAQDWLELARKLSEFRHESSIEET